MRRLSKVEHEHYDKCRSVWTDFIDSLDANKGLHELKTRKLTIVPLFYKTSSEASGINKLADELFERGDDYLCYLVANSMDDFTSIEQGEVIRRVFNYGEAFFDSDNNDWKNYHRAILPVNQTDVGSIQRLIFKMLFPHDYGVTQKSAGVHYCKANSERNKPISDWEEWQANTLGAAILLPENLIKQGMYLFSLGEKIECLNKIYYPSVYKRFDALADFLGCSKKALAIRMKQLGLLKKEYLDNPFDLVTVYPEVSEL